MIEDYCNRIKSLQNDKLQYKQSKQKAYCKNKVQEQEEKYHSYIIDQMNFKNKVIAANSLTSVVKPRATGHYREFFNCLLQINGFLRPNSQKINYSSGRTNESSEKQSECHLGSLIQEIRCSKQENTCSQVIAAKSICMSLRRIMHFQQKFNKINSFERIKLLAKQGEITQKMVNIMSKFSYRMAYKKIFLHSYARSAKKSDEHPFEDSFSVIMRSDGMKRNKSNHIDDDSYLDVIFEKQSQIQQCSNCKDFIHSLSLKQSQITKLREELNFTKTCLAQKSLVIKSKSQEATKLKQFYENKIQNIYADLSRQQKRLSSSSRISDKSHESSYYRQIQRKIIGQCRKARRSYIAGSHAKQQASDVDSNEQMQRELLGKYMRESFNQREIMDVARELCEGLQIQGRSQQGRIVAEVIRLLTPDEKLNASLN